MKVSINAISQAARDKQPADPKAPRIQKQDAAGTRFAFLVSMLDRTNDRNLNGDDRHDNLDSSGKVIAGFNQVFEVWFNADENAVILQRLAQAKAENKALHYTFTCSSASKGEVRAQASGNYAFSQTIILNADLSAPRTMQAVAKPPIQFLD